MTLIKRICADLLKSFISRKDAKRRKVRKEKNQRKSVQSVSSVCQSKIKSASSVCHKYLQLKLQSLFYHMIYIGADLRQRNLFQYVAGET